MHTNVVEIKVYDKREKMIATIHVEQLSDNVYRAIYNELFNCRLIPGTEFETRLNEDGNHEIIRIIKDSDFVTRRFFLTSQFKKSEYSLLGDEIMKNGGFWQVDFGNIATINLPKDCELNIDELFKLFDFNSVEIRD